MLEKFDGLKDKTRRIMNQRLDRLSKCEDLKYWLKRYQIVAQSLINNEAEISEIKEAFKIIMNGSDKFIEGLQGGKK